MFDGKPKVGSRVIIETAIDSTADDIVVRAIEKMRKHDVRFPDLVYSLRYPDGKEVKTLKESDEGFTLCGYQKELMKDYSKVCLFLQPGNNVQRYLCGNLLVITSIY